MGDLNSLYDQGLGILEPTDLTGSLKGTDNIYNHLVTMIKNAKKSVIIATTTKGLMRKWKALKNVY